MSVSPSPGHQHTSNENREQAVGLVLMPLIARIDDCSKENEILHQIRNIIFWNGIFFFSVKMSARRLKKIVHSLAIPPVEAKTNSVKEAISTQAPFAHSISCHSHEACRLRLVLSVSRTG